MLTFFHPFPEKWKTSNLWLLLVLYVTAGVLMCCLCISRSTQPSNNLAVKTASDQYYILSYVFTGILSATGNGYVIYTTTKRKTKLKPPEFMTLNLAVFDFGISGEFKWLDIMLLMMSSSVRCAFSKIEIMYYISEKVVYKILFDCVLKIYSFQYIVCIALWLESTMWQ